MATTHVPGPRRPFLTKQLKCQSPRLAYRFERGNHSRPGHKRGDFGCGKVARSAALARRRRARFRPEMRLIRWQSANRPSPGSNPRQPSATFEAAPSPALQPCRPLERWTSGLCFAGSKTGDAQELYRERSFFDQLALAEGTNDIGISNLPGTSRAQHYPPRAAHQERLR